MNKAKEMLMKGFNANCKEDENIIDLAIKEISDEIKKGINEDIQTARRCLEFKFGNCTNKGCLNESCPLNKANSLNTDKSKEA